MHFRNPEQLMVYCILPSPTNLLFFIHAVVKTVNVTELLCVLRLCLQAALTRVHCYVMKPELHNSFTLHKSLLSKIAACSLICILM